MLGSTYKEEVQYAYIFMTTVILVDRPIKNPVFMSTLFNFASKFKYFAYIYTENFTPNKCPLFITNNSVRIGQMQV